MLSILTTCTLLTTHSLQIHPHMPARLLDLGLELLHPLLGLWPGRPLRYSDRIRRGRRARPTEWNHSTIGAVSQSHVSRTSSTARSQCVLVFRSDWSVMTVPSKRNSSMPSSSRLVRWNLHAGVVQVIGVERAVLFEGRFDPLAPLAELGRGVERNVHPPHAPQRQAIKRDFNPAAHGGIVAMGADRVRLRSADAECGLRSGLCSPQFDVVLDCLVVSSSSSSSNSVGAQWLVNNMAHRLHIPS